MSRSFPRFSSRMRTLAIFGAFALAALLWRVGHGPFFSAHRETSHKISTHPGDPVPLARPAETAPIATARDDVATRLRNAAADGASWKAIQDSLDELTLENPDLALELAVKFGPSEKERYLAVSDLVQRWARREPQAALDWSIRQGRRWDAMDASLPYLVLNRLAQSDPGATIALAQETLARWVPRAGTNPGELAYTAINALLASDDPALARTAIERWSAAALGEQVGRDALERVAWRMSDDLSPIETLSWLQTLPASETRHDVAGSIAARWAEQEPKAAAAWADTLGEAAGHAEVMRAVLATWAEKDLTAAATWLSQREADPAADRIWADFAQHPRAASQDPGAALAFVALIQNRELRASTLESVLATWHERDPAAAVRYVTTSSSYTSAEKQRLLVLLTAD